MADGNTGSDPIGAMPANKESCRVSRLKLKAPATKQEMMRAFWAGVSQRSV
jgi:hypothetical protein